MKSIPDEQREGKAAQEPEIHSCPGPHCTCADHLPFSPRVWRLSGIVAQLFSPKVGHLSSKAGNAFTFTLEVSAYKTPACYYVFASFPSTNSIMFTSRSIMFALLSFLAGANACLQCPDTLNVGGSTINLHDTYPEDTDTFCSYTSSVWCQYYTVSAFWILCSLLFSVDMLAMASGQRPVAIWE
ncbi:uncharacterized protein EDB91DRAFT_793078 [Suillus paluster]|uniref:uncharacterized protein n=1 Tax=Suillus paluster TaxID=48578 RepID=UPI001B873415|nr:uncharacterized protein EDB91DRAFT_793078 [Suillus paluster]KAG1730111.1 hypothetical protein EDB91DRAFT_793078 [Suillus paluster]